MVKTILSSPDARCARARVLSPSVQSVIFFEPIVVRPLLLPLFGCPELLAATHADSADYI